MNKALSHRKATINDLRAILSLLLDEDELGQKNELMGQELDHAYIEAFRKIDSDPNHYLMVVESGTQILGTCHLTLLPSLTFKGTTRMQVEAVRVAEKHRGYQIGEWMLLAAIDHATSKGASIIQLTTNSKRLRAKKFYEKLGFEATHEGMKLFIKEPQN
jgi:ribosomal protein S18 acetylase RimI-like enzyme